MPFSPPGSTAIETSWTNEAYTIWVCPNEHQPLRTVEAWTRWSVFLVDLISRLEFSSPFPTFTMGFNLGSWSMFGPFSSYTVLTAFGRAVQGPVRHRSPDGFLIGVKSHRNRSIFFRCCELLPWKSNEFSQNLVGVHHSVARKNVRTWPNLVAIFYGEND